MKFFTLLIAFFTMLPWQASAQSPCSFDEVTLNLYDSYGDGGQTMTVEGVDYVMTAGTQDAFTLCLDLTGCIDLAYLNTDGYPSENSWDVTDASGAVIASGGSASGTVGTCATPCLFDAVTLNLYDSYGDGGQTMTVEGVDYAMTAGTQDAFTLCLDLTSCIDLTYLNTDGYPSENSWDVTDASGVVIASGGSASGQVGACAVQGCMDATATNYDAAATIDDGSCVYPCLDNAILYTAGSYAGENGFTITDCDGNVLADMAFGVAFFDGCIDLGSTYSVNLDDSYGDSWNGGTLSIDGVVYTLDGINDDGSSASVQVGTCPIPGCMDATAANYDATATVDDGSCTYGVPGCTDATACNYDAAATADDGNCTYAAAPLDCAGNCANGGSAVTLSLYDQYNDGWGYSDGSQSILTVDGVDYTITGGTESFTLCLDLTACTDAIFTPANGWDTENSWDVTDASGTVIASGGNASGQVGTCAVQGCMDATATNYDAAATIDDGSCVYPCLDNAILYTAGSYAGENSFTITDCDGNVLAEMTSGVTGFDGCIDLGSAYSVNLVDSYGDNWNGGTLSIDGVVYTLDGVNDDGTASSVQVGACPIPGCMDATAANYDATATVDDGSCTYGVPGCTDATACNYDAAATADDGTCTFAAAPLDCAGACANGGTAVTLNLYDSYGDGGQTMTVEGVDYVMTAGTQDAFTLCLDLTGCIDLAYLNTDGYPSENSWDVTDASGAVIASGADASGQVGTCAVQGCMDATATNYDAAATIDDGSCVYPCLDNAILYTAGSYAGENGFTITDCDGNVLADMAFGVAFFDGCIDLGSTYSVNLDDSYGDSWNGGTLSIDGVVYTLDGINDDGSSASVQVGTCPIPGCMDATAANYDATATVDDGSCTYGVPGCTDATACNYDAAATADDGNCTYAAAPLDCAGNCANGGSAVTLSLYDQYNDGWGYSDGSQSILTVDGVDYTITGGTESFTLCLDLTACTDAIFTPANGWDTENSWDVTDASGTVIASGGNASGQVGTCAVQGCMDATATNYDAAATIDDGSCVYPCLDNAILYTAGSYAGENSFTITDCDGNVLAEMTSGVTGFDGCIDLGSDLQCKSC